jgi:hypothetical protein
MKNILASFVVIAVLSGCYAYVPSGYTGEVYYEQPVVAVGFYDPAFGYWTGVGWDAHYYDYGHGGYGHPVYHGGRYDHSYHGAAHHGAAHH